MTEVQGRLLEILKWYHAFCVKHNLVYYIVGGTMLGAARHKGFIPWDDDIDVGMPRPDYERLKEICRSGAGEEAGFSFEFPMEKEDYTFTYAKLYDTKTTLVEDTRPPIKRGIFVDIFPLDGMGNTPEEVARNYRRLKLWTSLIVAKRIAVKKGRKWYKNALVSLMGHIPSFILDERKLFAKVEAFCKNMPYAQSAYIGNVVDAIPLNYITEKRFYGKPTLYTFEGIEVYGLERYDEYLSSLYGDWRQPPPVEKRTSGHSFVYMDLQKSYLE